MDRDGVQIVRGLGVDFVVAKNRSYPLRRGSYSGKGTRPGAGTPRPKVDARPVIEVDVEEEKVDEEGRLEEEQALTHDEAEAGRARVSSLVSDAVEAAARLVGSSKALDGASAAGAARAAVAQTVRSAGAAAAPVEQALASPASQGSRRITFLPNGRIDIDVDLDSRSPTLASPRAQWPRTVGEIQEDLLSTLAIIERLDRKSEHLMHRIKVRLAETKARTSQGRTQARGSTVNEVVDFSTWSARAKTHNC